MSNAVGSIFRAALKVALLVGVTAWLLFKTVAAQAMNANTALMKLEEKAQPISLSPGEVRLVLGKGCTLNFQPHHSREMLVTCGVGVKPEPKEGNE